LYENNVTTRESAEKYVVNQLVNIYQTTGQSQPEKFVKKGAKQYTSQMGYQPSGTQAHMTMPQQ
jgi:hypothetical protein